MKAATWPINPQLIHHPDAKQHALLDNNYHLSVKYTAGGGGGHEPGQSGYVGEGMLAAAVSGHLFASPSAKSVLAAIRAVAGKAGCLLIVTNYTGQHRIPHHHHLVHYCCSNHEICSANCTLSQMQPD